MKCDCVCNNNLVNTENIEQMGFVIRFLCEERREYHEYKSDTFLKFQAFSNVIELLNQKRDILIKKKNF